MAKDRLTKGDFYDLVSDLDEQALKKILWTLYWRGAGPVRQRIEHLLGAAEGAPEPSPPDPEFVLEDVREFVTLARAGAYIGGNRRVTPKQRTRWRHTFRELANQSLRTLRCDDEASVRAGADALVMLIDLAVDTQHYDYFRSEDPVAAAQFVVSDAVRALWLRIRKMYGITALAEQASGQLLRWESTHGWTRFGEGRVAAREVPLAQVLSEALTTPDMWNEFAVKYVEALEKSQRGSSRHVRRADADGLRVWHEVLSQQLVGSDQEHLTGRLGRR